jgi:hypothetical protein
MSGAQSGADRASSEPGKRVTPKFRLDKMLTGDYATIVATRKKCT